jgi:hypothetical protein
MLAWKPLRMAMNALPAFIMRMAIRNFIVFLNASIVSSKEFAKNAAAIFKKPRVRPKPAE